MIGEAIYVGSDDIRGVAGIADKSLSHYMARQLNRFFNTVPMHAAMIHSMDLPDYMKMTEQEIPRESLW